MATTITIDEAVRAAVKDNPQVSEVVEESTPETTTETKEPKYEYTQEEKDAIQLFQVLKNPETAQEMAAEIARRMGLDVSKREQKQVVKNVFDELKERVPEEQRFLIDSLGPAFQQLIETKLAEALAPVREQQAHQHEIQVNNEIDATFVSLSKKFPDIMEHQEAMNTLAAKFSANEGTSMSDYLEGLYKMVVSDKKVSKVVEKTVSKINRNLGEVKPTSAQVDDAVVQRGSKLPTIKEAVDAALRNERLF
jgi:nucleoid DNA-binding protein